MSRRAWRGDLARRLDATKHRPILRVLIPTRPVDTLRRERPWVALGVGVGFLAAMGWLAVCVVRVWWR